MSARTILTLLCGLALTGSAHAATKEYAFAPGNLGEVVTRFPFVTPSVESTALEFGHFFLEDDGLGSVTANELTFGDENTVTINFTGMGIGVGNYVYVRTRTTRSALLGGVGSGSSAAGGRIDWGVITGWSETGGSFCRSTTATVCTFISGVEDGTFPLANDLILESTSYDLGSWNFDAEGGFEATPYISSTTAEDFVPGMFFTTNRLVVLRGRFVGSSAPALPLAGAGAFAAAALMLAARRLKRSG